MLFTPSSFVESDRTALHELIRSNSFATLISPDADDPWITHLPLLLDTEGGEQGVLLGHLARANPHWQRLAQAPIVTVVFHGPHAYVSPALYRNHPSVPTWNYATVHVRGTARTFEAGAELAPLVRRMTSHYEQSREQPWAMALPEDYFQSMLRNIVGVEITITALTGKFKLSQNRSAADRSAVIEAFEKGNATEQALATLMRIDDL
ncbi:MAG TPA: FMN-binding negative transcriptional regulator [Burkholderiales bacterium]|nr:FMN-binding negative transcriptional regulator [Burkholderiales bacterium]